MWPSGRDLWPFPAALPLPQNFTAYNPGGNHEIQNQQGTNYENYAHYAPYSDQARPMPYSQQGGGVRLPQDQMAGDMGHRDQNWHFQNRNRRESMLEYQNEEVVMVRCNQQKWLQGVIQRMSAQGLRIWIMDANILVNVPLVLVPTHVMKMSTYSELQGLPPRVPMWTMAVTDKNGCRKALVQCVRPAHLSHRQLFHKFGCVECAFCKATVSPIDVVSPWNCSHQVHNYCLQLRMQHSSTTDCPSCNEMGTSQPMPVPSPADDSNLQVPSTFAGIGRSTSQHMSSTSTSNAFTNPNDEQHQQLFHLQCACGFRGSIDSVCVGNVSAPVFCPNCHQPVNINPMMIGVQSGEPFSGMDLDPRSYSEVNREIIQRKSIQDRGFGWPMQFFRGSSRLDAIEEGSREGICSTPPSPDQTDDERGELSYLPSYLVAFGEAFGEVFDNMSDPDGFAVSSIDRNMQPSPSSRSSLNDNVLTAPSPTQATLNQKGKSSVRSSLQDGVLTAASPTQVTPIGNEQFSARRSLQDGVLTAPFPTEVTLYEQSVSQSSLQDGVLTASSPTQVTLYEQSVSRSSLQDGTSTATPPPIQKGQSSSQVSPQYGSLYASSSTRITLVQDEESTNNALRPKECHIGPLASSQVNNLTVPEVQEADESSEREVEAETPSLSDPLRQKFWRANEVKRMASGDFDEDSEESEESEESEKASSSNNFAAIAPSAPPVYVNHFENFVKLAVANASTAKEVLASATASQAPATVQPAPVFDLPPSKSPTSTWITPAPAMVKPAPVFDLPPSKSPTSTWITPAPAMVKPAPVFDLPPSKSPTSTWITPAPAMVKPAPVFDLPPSKSPTSTWITPAPAMVKPAPVFDLPPSKSPTSTWIVPAPAMVKPAPVFDLPPSKSPTSTWIVPAPAMVKPAPVFGLPPSKSPTSTWITPAPAIVKPAPVYVTPSPTFFTRRPALITETPAVASPARAFYSRAALMMEPPSLVTEPPALVTEGAIVTPARAFYSRAPSLMMEASPLVTEPPTLVTEGAIVAPARAFYSRAPAMMIEPPPLVAESPALVTEGAIVSPARAFFSRVAGLITEPPGWVTKVQDLNGPGPSGEASPGWITVIKDGVDARRDDAKQWELDRLARQKEAEFF